MILEERTGGFEDYVGGEKIPMRAVRCGGFLAKVSEGGIA